MKTSPRGQIQRTARARRRRLHQIHTVSRGRKNMGAQAPLFLYTVLLASCSARGHGGESGRCPVPHTRTDTAHRGLGLDFAALADEVDHWSAEELSKAAAFFLAQVDRRRCKVLISFVQITLSS